MSKHIVKIEKVTKKNIGFLFQIMNLEDDWHWFCLDLCIKRKLHAGITFDLVIYKFYFHIGLIKRP